MGRISTTIKLTNHIDEIDALRGLIRQDKIRTLEVPAYVDTEVTHLCLSRRVIERLGLMPMHEVLVTTANGKAKARIFSDAKISVFGRDDIFSCIELPETDHALLGVIPLRALGIELDLESQTLSLLPMNSKQSYFKVMTQQVLKRD